MRVLLMHPDRDFSRSQPLPRRDRDLTQDLELETLFEAMTGDDALLLDVARRALLTSDGNDVETVTYRQEVVKDSLKNADVVRGLHQIAVDAMEKARKHRMWDYGVRYPAAVLSSAIDLMKIFVDVLRELRDAAELHAQAFDSRGFTALFATLRRELSDDYLRQIETHLTDLRFPGGVLVSASLAEGNRGTDYVLREERDKRSPFVKWLLGTSTRGYAFHIPERDDAGFSALSELRGRGINLVANALAQSTDHILSFFQALRAELAFCVGCINLHEKLAAIAAPSCFPEPQPAGTRTLHFDGLYDICLALKLDRTVVANAVNADRKSLVVITGANQGGKSTFLRSIGVAQLMMQSGMFVPAESFAGELCSGVFTHYKREEDPGMEHGKLDEELKRMSDIAETISPDALVLFNESFASTNDREGSEIAGQIVRALLEKRIRAFFVTHLVDFARGMFDRKLKDALFLRAERLADGTRTFRVVEGEPLETSYGEDLYREVFTKAAQQ